MEKSSEGLEKRVLDLILQDKIVEAVASVNNELSCGLKVAKNTVDEYRDMNAFNSLLSKAIRTPPKSN